MAGTREQSDNALFLDYVLRVTKGRIRLTGAASAAMLMLAVAAGFALVAVAGDHHLPGGLSATARLVLRWALLVGEFGIAAALVAYPLIRRLNDLYVTRLIEKAHPEFRNDLTAALQLARDRRAHAGTVAAVRKRAAEEVERADVRASVSMHRVRTSGMAAGAAVAIFALYWLVAPKAVWPSLRRAFGDDGVSPPTRTEIVSVSPPSGTIVLSGTPVDFSALIRRAEGPPLVQVSRDGGKTFLSDDVLVMHPTGQDGADQGYAARWPAAAANDGLAVFQVLCGDATGAPHELTVLPRPAVREVRVRLDWPAYTRRPPTELSGGHVEALLGSRATVFAEANLPVRRASLIFSGRGPVIMSTTDAGTPDAPDEAAGRRMSGAFVVRGDDRYRIAFHGTHELVRGESMEYTVKAFTDEPPEVQLTEPVGDVELAVNEVLHLAGEARDRFGIGRVELVCENGDARLRHVSLEPLLVRTAGQVIIEGSLPVALLGRRGERLRCWVEARDLLPPDGQVGRSDAFVLAIKEPDAQIAADDASEETAPGEEGGAQEAEPGGNREGEGEAEVETAPGAPARDADEGLLELVRKDADKLDTLLRHLDPGPQPEAPQPPAQEGNRGEGQGDAQDEGAGEGQREREGQNASEGQGEGADQGNGEGQGEGPEGQGKAGQGQEQGTAEGQGEGQGHEQGQGQGAGEGQGQGHGQGAGEGQGEGGGQGQGEGSGQGQGSPSGGGRGAEGMHSGAAGGDSESGSSDEPARLDTTTRPDELTPRQRERLESVGRALDEARRRIRDDEVDPKLLEELGMTRGEFEAFVEEYTRRFGQLEPMPTGTPSPGGRLGGAFTLPGSDRLQPGKGRDGDIGDVEGGEELSPDEVRRLRESRLRRVSPEYRKQAESYFKSISEQAPPTPATSPAG